MRATSPLRGVACSKRCAGGDRITRREPKPLAGRVRAGRHGIPHTSSQFDELIAVSDQAVCQVGEGYFGTVQLSTSRGGSRAAPTLSQQNTLRGTQSRKDRG